MKNLSIPILNASTYAFACIIAEEHLLIEDIPGTGKTNLARNLAKLTKLSTKRVQCTNDLMPADILGFNKASENKIEFVKGPIFTNLLLVDELNRAPSRTQSGLLEGMEESQVSIDGFTRKLPKPFMVIATQNPRDQIGIFELPESQVDRFSMSISMDKIKKKDYLNLINLGNDELLDKKLNYQALVKLSKKVIFKDELLVLLLDIFEFIENTSGKNLAIRPRLQIIKLVKAYAAMCDRDFIIPEDIFSFLPPCLRHRLKEYEEPELIEMIKKAIVKNKSS